MQHDNHTIDVTGIGFPLNLRLPKGDKGGGGGEKKREKEGGRERERLRSQKENEKQNYYKRSILCGIKVMF